MPLPEQEARQQREGKLAQTKVTTDHATIQRWAKARGGRPAAVSKTHKGNETGIIRIEFPDAPNARDAALEEISWDEFFEKFEDSKLALLYQEETSEGARSNFNKLVSRETVEAREHGDSPASRHRR
jgi:hypothetical protein